MKTLDKASVAVFVFVVTTLAGVTSAFATTAPIDQIGGQLEGVQTDIVDFVTTYAIPVLFFLLLVGIAIRLGMKYAQRGANKV